MNIFIIGCDESSQVFLSSSYLDCSQLRCSLGEWCSRWWNAGGARVPPATTPLSERGAEGAEASANGAEKDREDS